MRPDGRQEGLRQAMSWLHTWSGLVLGWLLFAVFLTGTLSYVRDEISVWMQPEQHASQADRGTAARALAAMAVLAPRAEAWNLSLPGPREPAVSASWREPGAPAGRAGLSRALLDAGTGEPIVARQTRGGDFLYRFHFELYGMPRTWARWIVGIATMFMLAAIVSGVITHKKIFADFFTFRPGKGQRSWLDAHNGTAVLALPFHFVITFSGLLLLMYQLMPWGIDAAYRGDVRAFFEERRGVQAQPRGPVEAAAEAAAVAGMPDVDAMVAQAQARWGRPVDTITVDRAAGRPATLELRERGGTSLLERGAPRRLVFDAGRARCSPPSIRPHRRLPPRSTTPSPACTWAASPGRRCAGCYCSPAWRGP